MLSESEALFLAQELFVAVDNRLFTMIRVYGDKTHCRICVRGDNRKTSSGWPSGVWCKLGAGPTWEAAWQDARANGASRIEAYRRYLFDPA